MDSARAARLREVIEPFEHARPLPLWAFVDEEIFEAEQANIFQTHPIPIAHTSDVDKPGDWVRAPLLGEHVVVVRGADLEIHALHAVCRHRGTLLCEGERGRFERLEIVSSFYSGGDVGLDVAYRVVRDGKPELDSRAGAVEQGLFQLVLDHEDNRAVLARQATERLPVSRTYLPTLFVNIVGQRAA